MTIQLHPEFTSQTNHPKYLLGISGGRDSVALLHLLLDLGIHNITLCHLNHQLRGSESSDDAAFVKELADKYQLQCEIGLSNIPERINQTGESLELAARNARHEFFAHCSQKYNCQHTLLAHHADDQAETILFKLLRGSSRLKGMSYNSRYEIKGKTLKLIRPLLLVPRSKINNYIHSRHITFREDASNAEAIAVRNRLRNEAIPLLSDIMGRDVNPMINRAAETAVNQEKALREILSQKNLEDPQGRLYLPSLRKLSKALQQIALHDYLVKHHIPSISQEMIQQCLDVIHPDHAAKLNLPSNRFFRRKEQRAFIE